jgi:nicotinamide phosphoribosyltransferase
MKYPPTLLCDFYKVSHREQYPKGTEYVYSTWIPRESRIEGVRSVVAFGFQAFIQRYLVDYFNENFFDRDEEDVVMEYKRLISWTLGGMPDATHIRKLHRLGYLPLEIKALPEGTLTPLRVPMLTIENTHPEFFWLTNYIETLFSTEVWLPSTAATLAFEYRKMLEAYCDETGGASFIVPFQGHDFSMRGMSSLESAAAAGAGHLLSFSGTDTIPAIFYLEQHYGANIEHELVGTSIPATEHSVMCAGTPDGKDERAMYKRLLTELYPAGMVSVVSDTWDLWGVLETVLPSLHDEIMAREPIGEIPAKLVVRPDSGDPVKIICGDAGSDDWRARKGVVEMLWDEFGGTTTDKGYKQLDSHVGVIYGDAITLARCEAICKQLKEKGFASTNMVYGIGSFTYQYNTRDTFGFALKATQVTINGEEIAIFKDPATDKTKMKKSLVGRCVVIDNIYTDAIEVIDHLDRDAQEQYLEEDLLTPIFIDGKVMKVRSLAEIRTRLLSQIPAKREHNYA